MSSTNPAGEGAGDTHELGNRRVSTGPAASAQCPSRWSGSAVLIMIFAR